MTDTGKRSIELIVCRTIKSFHSLIPQLKAGNCQQFIVASDDYKIHEFCKKYASVSGSIYLTNLTSHFTASESVLLILGEVNSWLKKLRVQSSMPNELLYWESHAEGGDTTQRLQDGIILANTYFEILKTIAPKKVYLELGYAKLWEDQLFAACATELRIPIEKVVISQFHLTLKKILIFFRPILKEVYLSVKVMGALLSIKERLLKVPKENFILIELCPSGIGHINHTKLLAHSLSMKNIPVIVVGWSAGVGIGTLKRDGFLAIKLERWVSFRGLLHSWIYSYVAWQVARRNIDSLLTDIDSDISLYGRLLRPAVIASMRNFFFSQIPHRYRLYTASKFFYVEHRPVAMRLWTRVLPQALTMFQAIPKIWARPILFWQPGWPYNLEEPLKNYPVPCDLFFAISDAHKNLLIKEGVTSDLITVSGISWGADLLNKRKSQNKKASRVKLGILDDQCFCIFFDFGGSLLGWLTPMEQFLQLNALIDLALNNPNLYLIIKPHPTENTDELENVIQAHHLPNVHYVKKELPVFDYLNAADLLITKLSTLSLEAMFLEVPIVAVLLDREHRFKVYENGVDYAYTISELSALINRLISDKSQYSVWSAELVSRANDYLNRHGLNMDYDANEIIASALERKISNGPC